MSIAASGDELSSSEGEDLVGLPPSGVVATAESDPELTAMLSWATVRMIFLPLSGMLDHCQSSNNN